MAGASAELWFNARPMLLEVAVPALLMGFSFPLANAVIQRTERSVGRRAGMLYLANTAGAVVRQPGGGLLLLPMLGIQRSATVLMVVAALADRAALSGARGPADPSPSPDPAIGSDIDGRRRFARRRRRRSGCGCCCRRLRHHAARSGCRQTNGC